MAEVVIKVKRRNLTVATVAMQRDLYLTNTAARVWLKCRLKPADYRYFVYATDIAGNRARPVDASSDPLIVR